MARTAAKVAGISLLLMASAVACRDLFHSTSDILNACDIDAQTPGCAPDAAIDFCQWTPKEARRRAAHACAWLGACETPMGRNAFGPCMFQALLAYDCEANPNHPTQGKARALWACLANASGCGDVDACIFPGGREVCRASGSACGTAGGAPGSNADVRFECDGNGHGGVGSRPGGENCALWGQTCAIGAAGAVCAGLGGTSCSEKGCTGAPRTELRWCDGGDQGVDCAGNGAQFCVGFADAGAPWVACAASSDAGACTPDPTATCSGGVAHSCPAGVLEQIDCASLLLSDGACTPGALTPPFDWTSPCAVSPAQCAETCVDGGMIGCVRGASFPLDCTEQGLADCTLVSTDMGTATHPVCAAP